MRNALRPIERKDCDDQELVIRAQNGDTEAFSPLVRKYQEKIYNLIYRKVGDRETAQDLCQEVFLKAWQALPNFKGHSVFYSWLYQIAVNCSIDFLRKRDREIVFACEELPQNADDCLPMLYKQPSPCQILEREELGRIIRSAVHRLPSGQCHAFRLRYLEDLPIKEIASRLGKSETPLKHICTMPAKDSEICCALSTNCLNCDFCVSLLYASDLKRF